MSTIAKILKIQTFVALNQTPQALQTLKNWALQEPTQPLWYNTLHLLYRNGIDPHQIIKTLHDLEKNMPENILPTLYLADLYLRIQSMHAATNYLKRALNQADNELLQTSLIFQLGAIYYDNKQYKNLKELHKNYAAIAEQSAPFLNLMAYYHATREKKLPARTNAYHQSFET